MAFVGEYRITGSNIHHMKNGQSVAVVETAIEDPAAMILDAVRVGRAGPFECSIRQGDHVMLVPNSGPLDLFALIKAALQVTV